MTNERLGELSRAFLAYGRLILGNSTRRRLR